MSYELASELLYQGPPGSLFQLIPEWVTTPLEGEEQWIAENLDMWDRRVSYHRLRPVVASLGGTAGLRAAWIGWFGAYEVASSVLPRIETLRNTEVVRIDRPLQNAEAHQIGTRETISVIPLLIELFLEALVDPLGSEDIWDRIHILMTRAQREDWFREIAYLNTIDASLWQALVDLEASLPGALESLETGRRLGDIHTYEDSPVSRLLNSIEFSINTIDLTYAGAPFRFIDYEVSTSRISNERRWMRMILLARWWNEVQRRLPIRDIIRDEGPDIVE
jgi:hypothetical protein